MGDKKTHIYVSPFHVSGRKDGYNENLDQIVYRMERIKRATGKDVYTIFNNTLVTTEMGPPEQMKAQYMKLYKGYTDGIFCSGRSFS